MYCSDLIMDHLDLLCGMDDTKYFIVTMRESDTDYGEMNELCIDIIVCFQIIFQV